MRTSRHTEQLIAVLKQTGITLCSCAYALCSGVSSLASLIAHLYAYWLLPARVPCSLWERGDL